MKKIVPILSIIGASALIVGVSTAQKTEKKENFINYFNSFKEDVEDFSKVDTQMTSIALNKYKIALDTELKDLIESNENSEMSLMDNASYEIDEKEDSQLLNQENQKEVAPAVEEDIVREQISTLYNLSSDIENSCDDFCELKENLSNAILETQKLIEKVQQKELELSNEQKLFITEQAQQLKNLGRQLSSSTTELSISLSDLHTLMASNNQDMDKLSMKYLVVLDNLVNGNEMLQSGLETVTLMNQMFNMNLNTLPSNNRGRVLYGFQQNNNPPVVKDYYINENNELIDNTNQNEKSEETETNTNNENDENTENLEGIDTFKNSKLRSNIDTYSNTNLPHNVDSFFNTALLDNEFMYGNGYGNNGYYGANPYMQGYANYERTNTTNGVDRLNKTPNNEDYQENSNNESNKNFKKKKRKFELKKNIDTYKDANEPDIKTKLGNIKNSIKGFFSKTEVGDEKKIQNPVFEFEKSNR